VAKLNNKYLLYLYLLSHILLYFQKKKKQIIALNKEKATISLSIFSLFC